MKIAILAAGSSMYFPILFSKPKSLYHVNDEIQLEKVILNVLKIVDESQIIIVGGYKCRYIKKFLKKYPKITLKINYNYNKPAIYSFRKAVENENEDIVFLCADESISLENIKKISSSKRKMSILYHEDYYYYSLGIFKLSADNHYLFFDDKYLNMNAMKEIYCFANNKKIYDGSFSIYDGVCIGYIIIDLIRIIGAISKIDNPSNYNGTLIDFIKYDPKKEYVNDLDRIEDTDEYKKSVFLRIAYNCFSKPLLIVFDHFRRKRSK